MQFAGGANWLLIPLQILVVDLLLGADNALLIALACRGLDPRDRRRAAAAGVAGAVATRVVMTMAATWLLTTPLVKLIGAFALIVIAMNICEGAAPDPKVSASRRETRDPWAAAAVIVIANTVMSLDNVVALATIARGNFWGLAAGVLLSLPILGYGGLVLASGLQRAPNLTLFAAAMLGWIAGDMAISDPLVAPWADANAPALVVIAPWLGAAFVFLHDNIRPRAPAPPRRERRAPAETRRFDRLAIVGTALLAIVGVIFMVRR